MKRALNNKRKAVLTVDKGTLYEAGAEADSYSDDEDDTVETNAYAQIKIYIYMNKIKKKEK